jgi:hypothetical protein
MKPLMNRKWSPSAKDRADPGEILREAMADATAGRARLALVKHLWFHKNAIKLRPSLSGVRRSYALSAWRNLGAKYLPALRELVKARNEAERAVWRQRDPWPAFHDLKSINEYLGEVKRTVSLFRALHKRSPRRAKRVYSGAEEALFRAGEFQMCNHYLRPLDRFGTIRRTYRVNLRLAKDPTIGANFVEFAQSSFMDKATRLVALLALNNRVSEAHEIARKALRVWRDEQFKAKLAAAKCGRLE